MIGSKSWYHIGVVFERETIERIGKKDVYTSDYRIAAGDRVVS